MSKLFVKSDHCNYCKSYDPKGTKYSRENLSPTVSELTHFLIFSEFFNLGRWKENERGFRKPVDEQGGRAPGTTPAAEGCSHYWEKEGGGRPAEIHGESSGGEEQRTGGPATQRKGKVGEGNGIYSQKSYLYFKGKCTKNHFKK